MITFPKSSFCTNVFDHILLICQHEVYYTGFFPFSETRGFLLVLEKTCISVSLEKLGCFVITWLRQQSFPYNSLQHETNKVFKQFFFGILDINIFWIKIKHYITLVKMEKRQSCLLMDTHDLKLNKTAASPASSKSKVVHDPCQGSCCTLQTWWYELINESNSGLLS